MRIIVKNLTPKEPEGERENLRRVVTGTLHWTPMGWEVDGDVCLSEKDLESIPHLFYRVTGCFFVHNNRLTSLIGSPRIVGENFVIKQNRLIDLTGAPEEVGGDFWARDNFIVSLKGSPKVVGGSFSVYSNRLTDLTGAPEEVRGDFSASYNILCSTKGIPKKIRGSLLLNCNPSLTGLDEFPEEVDGNLYLRGTSVPHFDRIPGLRGQIHDEVTY